MERLRRALVGTVARLPVRVYTKLLAAFLVIAALLIVTGLIALYELSAVNARAQELARLQQKTAAYRQVQHDTTLQLYGITAALLAADARTLDSAMRQLNEFGYDLERLQYVAKDEVDLLAEVRHQYESFVTAISRVAALIRDGRIDEARAAELRQAGPAADTIARLTDQLLNKAESDEVEAIQSSAAAYRDAQIMVAGFAVASIVLALLLGYVISSSLIGPVEEIAARLSRIAAGDFAQQTTVENRDELGTLATNLNRTAADLGRLYAELEAASRHKSQFLASMSHELRTPLNAILGYTELILDDIYGAAPPRMREVLGRVQTNGKHLLGLINDVLDLSKIEAGQLTLQLASYSVKDMLQSAYVAVEPLAVTKKIALRLDLANDLPAATGDERRLAQVVLNLVGNAIKFTDEGEVTIAARVAGGSVLIQVIDTGPGVAAADQEKIFEEFQQADNAATRAKGGTGLGLAISRRIVTLHGGRLWVESALGKGSTFSVSLPVTVERQVETA